MTNVCLPALFAAALSITTGGAAAQTASKRSVPAFERGSAQSFPSKPLRIMVTAIAGSAPDVRLRQVAPKLAEGMGQTVIVENRPGANGTIAAQLAARAQPDGHTLLSALVNNAINDLLHPNACCRLNHELAPVAHFSLSPLVMVIHPSVPETTLQEYPKLA